MKSRLIIGLILLALHPAAALIERGPYLQQADDTSIIIRWRTTERTLGTVRYGDRSPAALDSILTETRATYEHSLMLTRLRPNTRYYYTIANDGVCTTNVHYFVTAPRRGTHAPTRILVLGDSGTGSKDAYRVRDAYKQFTGNTYTDLILMLGDNARPNGTDEEYTQRLFNVYPELLSQSALWPSIGTHDARSSFSFSQTGPYFDAFTLPTAGELGGVASGTESYYSFDHGDIHFICLDSADTDLSENSAMYTWAKHDLASTKQRWIIAYWHHPPYTKGRTDSDDPTAAEGRLVQIRRNFLPMLEAGGVDLVLSGHSGGYERSYLLGGHYGHSTTFDPTIHTRNSDFGHPGTDDVYTKTASGTTLNEGTVYVVAGSSGSSTSMLGWHPAMARSMGELGSLVIDVSHNHLEVRFLDDRGDARDLFRLAKPLEAPPNTPAAFNSSHIGHFDATVGKLCNGMLAGFVVEPNGDPLSFSLESGPDWLAMRPDGTFFGRPDITHIGLNSWTVLVRDKDGFDAATLHILVQDHGLFYPKITQSSSAHQTTPILYR